VSYPRFCIVALAAAVATAASSEYLSAKRKIEQIESDKLKAGTRVNLNQPELNAWVQEEAPAGVRNPKVQVLSPGMVMGSALIDFNKLRRSQGHEPGWFSARLLPGEHPVTVTARVDSGNGQARVDVQRVQISGLTMEKRMVDFLISDILLPMYPNAVVGQQFEMGHHIDHLDVQPAAVGVLIGR
jgi:hypothetical protein